MSRLLSAEKGGKSVGEAEEFQALRTKRHKLYCVTLDLRPCERGYKPHIFICVFTGLYKHIHI